MKYPMLLLIMIMIMTAPILASPGLERAPVNGGYLTYQQSGEGEVILTIHGALVADSFVPIMNQPVLDGYRLIRYRRSGYSDSAPLDLSTGGLLEKAAADAVALLDHLEVDRAHVVGHSLGGMIALELAWQSPERVQTLMLLEPAIMQVPAAEQMLEQIAPALAHHEDGDSVAAVDAFLTRLIRPEWQELMESQMPGAVDQAIANADTFFGIEVPALAQHEFDGKRAARLSMPALYVLGSESSAIAHADGFFEQGKQLLLQTLPNARSVRLEGVDHSLQFGFPERLASTITEFVAAHPIEE